MSNQLFADIYKNSNNPISFSADATILRATHRHLPISKPAEGKNLLIITLKMIKMKQSFLEPVCNFPLLQIPFFLATL
jgi:hypothetical protein